MNGNTPPPFLSDEDIAVLKRTSLRGFTEDEQASFIRQCQRTLLDPFSKQIFATRRYTKKGDQRVPALVVVTSILGLTAIAARTGHYNGCEITWAGKDGIWQGEWLSEDEFPTAAKCVVHHKQREYPEVGIARWSGYAGTAWNPSTKRHEVTDFWARLPDFMLGKVAKAQALRGAFPDQCSAIYITEELQGGISEPDDHDDEDKVTEIRRREAEIAKNPPKGTKFVEPKQAPLPTPAEAAEPAFPEDREPPKPVSAPTKPAAQAPPPPVAAAQQEPDDLDMGDQEPTPAEDAAAPLAGDQAWREHVITGLKNEKFFKRKVGDLTPTELAAIEGQWLPKVRKVWDEVNSAQKADAEAFEAAIAFSKSDRPW